MPTFELRLDAKEIVNQQAKPHKYIIGLISAETNIFLERQECSGIR